MIQVMKITISKGKEGSQEHVKIEVLEFDGKMQGDVFLDWLYTVERIFDFKDI